MIVVTLRGIGRDLGRLHEWLDDNYPRWGFDKGELFRVRSQLDRMYARDPDGHWKIGYRIHYMTAAQKVEMALVWDVVSMVESEPVIYIS